MSSHRQFWAGYPSLTRVLRTDVRRMNTTPCVCVASFLRFIWRTVTLQWKAKDGTIAADTHHYPFGTRFFVPGWGWGSVQDRGGAIKVSPRSLPWWQSWRALSFCFRGLKSDRSPISPQGPTRLDLYYSTREGATKWGRQNVDVIVQRTAAGC